MTQTFYIESDEEIISVIGRLRKSSSEENIFVFPKRALVLQSIVNLRLFQREAQKLGKTIVIVSQDEVGKMLAEKAGIRTEKYSEDFSQKSSHLELVPQGNTVAAKQPAILQDVPRSETIGSSDFYSGDVAAMPRRDMAAPKAVSPSTTTLRIRNASPEKLTSLNSKRVEGIHSQESMPRPLVNVSMPSARVVPPQPVTPAQVQSAPSQPSRDERLKNFYSGTRAASSAATTVNIPQGTVSISGNKAHLIFLILGGISLVSLLGALLFFFLPKAEVHVTPYKTMRTADVELAGRTDVMTENDTAFPVRLLEKEERVTFTVATTGISGGTNQKARGTVVIYNNYSSDPQPLVATTRLETPDGKLFRLVSGVTVPGMTGAGTTKEPGAIEAQVVADQTGAEYNIDPTTFTIPGFKGGPKYEKFSAKSTRVMTGGGSGGVSDIAAVAQVDIDTAEREAKEKAKEAFLDEIRSTLSPDEKVLEEQMDIAALTTSAVPQTGTVANAFDYQNTFKVRAFVFSEKSVREKIESTVEKEVGGVRFIPVSVSITYADSLPNFSDSTVRLKAHALVTMESDIDRDMLKAALLGQNAEGIKNVLNAFPAVKKVNVVFSPQLFVQSIPKSESRVSIVVEPGEDAE